MKYLCTNCSYTFDEAFWDESEEIAPATKIEEIDICPACLEKDTFYQIKEEAIYIEDNTNDIFEQEHFIELEHKNRKLNVKIWDLDHPMEKDHRILSVMLFDEYGDLVYEKFLNIWDDLNLVFDDYDLDEVEIRVKCSKHGNFAKKFALTY